MTPHSVGRADGVCLDELAFARALGKKIIPVRIADVETPLLVARIQWLDATAYRPGERSEVSKAILDAIVRKLQTLLAGNDVNSGQSWSAALEHLFRSVDLLTHDADYDAEIVGRQWLVADISDWVSSNDNAHAMWITGPPGIGKSAISHLLRRHLKGASALHTCKHYDTRLNDPREVILSLASQLATAWPPYREALINEASIDQLDEASPDAIARFLLTDIPRNLVTHTPLILLVDGMDEAGSEDNPLASLFKRIAPKLPPNLRLIVTGRDTQSLQSYLYGFDRFQLMPGDDRHIDDLRNYCTSRLCKISGIDSQETTTSLVERSEGNFLFLRSATDWISRNAHRVEGIITLPPDLIGIYSDYIERCARNRDDFEKNLRPILELLIACRQPPTIEMLGEMTRLSTYEVSSFFDRLGPLFMLHSGGITPFHKSFLDWLVDPQANPRFFVERYSGERRLVDALRNRSAETGSWKSYLSAHGAHHLWNLQEYPVLLELFDEDWGNTRESLVHIVTEIVLSGSEDYLPPVLVNFIETQKDRLEGETGLRLGRRITESLIDRGAITHLRMLARELTKAGFSGSKFSEYAELRVQRAKGNTKQVIKLGQALLTHEAEFDDGTRSELHRLVGDGLRESGQHSAAYNHYSSSLAQIETRGLSKIWFLAASALADLDYVAGRLNKARKQCAEAIEMTGKIDVEPGGILLQFFRVLGNVEYVSCNYSEALRFFNNTLDIALATRRPFRELEARNSIAETLIELDIELAYKELFLARTLAKKYEAWLEYGKSFYIEGQAMLFEGRPDEATKAAREGLRILNRVGYGSGKHRCRLVLAQAAYDQGNLREAAGHAQAALNYFRQERIYPSHQLQSILIQARCGRGQPWYSFERLIQEIETIENISEFPQTSDLLQAFKAESKHE